LPALLSSKLNAAFGDLSSRGKVVRGGARGGGGRGGGRGGQGHGSYESGRKSDLPDLYTGKRRGDDKQPDFGENANKIPLGGKGGGGGLNKQRGGKGVANNKKATPHFYSNPMSMSLDDELGSSAMRMKRAAR
jgi:hypothetical protein